MAKKTKKPVVCTRCAVELSAKERESTQEVVLCEKCAEELAVEYAQEIAEIEQSGCEAKKTKKNSFLRMCITWLTLVSVLAGGFTATIYALIWLFS